jgi:undecaprenyl-diphosphatase
MGDGPFWLIVVFVSALIGQTINVESFFRLSILLMVGLAISNVAFGLCKTRIKRRRPYADLKLQQELGIEIKNRDPGHGSKEMESFPSGHVLWTTVCVCLICSEFGYAGVMLLGWMIPAMMFLRLYLGVHYPSDILAGLFLGGINVLITLIFAPTLLEILSGVRSTLGFLLGYWIFIFVFLIIGFKSWLKRV